MSSSAAANEDYTIVSSIWEFLVNKSSAWDKRKVAAAAAAAACLLVVVVVGLLSAQVHHLGSLDSRLRRFEEAVEGDLREEAVVSGPELQQEPEPEPWNDDLGGGCRFTSVGYDCRLLMLHGGGNLRRRNTEDTFDSCRKWCFFQSEGYDFDGECLYDFT